MSITLEELLLSRDKRKQLQEYLLQKYQGKTLICLTVVMPGNNKRNENSLTVAKAGINEVEKMFEGHILYSQHNDLQTGYEFFAITDIDPNTSKKISCHIEENHLLGRLFDIDIIDTNGIPIQRESVGYEKRKCLVCDNEARFCMRNFTHTQEKIQQKISSMIENYKQMMQ